MYINKEEFIKRENLISSIEIKYLDNFIENFKIIDKNRLNYNIDIFEIKSNLEFFKLSTKYLYLNTVNKNFIIQINFLNDKIYKLEINNIEIENKNMSKNYRYTNIHEFTIKRDGYKDIKKEYKEKNNQQLRNILNKNIDLILEYHEKDLTNLFYSFI